MDFFNDHIKSSIRDEQNGNIPDGFSYEEMEKGIRDRMVAKSSVRKPIAKKSIFLLLTICALFLFSFLIYKYNSINNDGDLIQKVKQQESSTITQNELDGASIKSSAKGSDEMKSLDTGESATNTVQPNKSPTTEGPKFTSTKDKLIGKNDHNSAANITSTNQSKVSKGEKASKFTDDDPKDQQHIVEADNASSKAEIIKINNNNFQSETLKQTSDAGTTEVLGRIEPQHTSMNESVGIKHQTNELQVTQASSTNVLIAGNYSDAILFPLPMIQARVFGQNQKLIFNKIDQPVKPKEGNSWYLHFFAGTGKAINPLKPKYEVPIGVSLKENYEWNLWSKLMLSKNVSKNLSLQFGVQWYNARSRMVYSSKLDTTILKKNIIVKNVYNIISEVNTPVYGDTLINAKVHTDIIKFNNSITSGLHFGVNYNIPIDRNFGIGSHFGLSANIYTINKGLTYDKNGTVKDVNAMISEGNGTKYLFDGLSFSANIGTSLRWQIVKNNILALNLELDYRLSNLSNENDVVRRPLFFNTGLGLIKRF